MTIGDALPLTAVFLSIAAILIAFFRYSSIDEREKLRLRADLLKAGIDPGKLDKEGEDE